MKGSDASDFTPVGWMRIPLVEVVLDIQSGFASGKHNSTGVGVIHMRPMNVSRNGTLDFSETKHIEDTSERRLRVGDVLFNNTNSAALVGKTAYVNSDVELAFSNHMTRVRTDSSRLDAKFLATQLHALWMNGYFEEICSNHVNQASVSTKRLKDVEINLPPVEEQKKIVEILEEQFSRLDAALTSVRAVREKSVRFRRSLLHAAFTGELTGHDTRDGKLPSSWINQTIGELANVKTGKIDVNAAVEDGEYPFFTCAREIYRINDAPYEGRVVLVAGNGDLNVKYYEGKFNAYQRTYFLSVTNEEKLIPKYLFLFLEMYVEHLRKVSIGTTIKYIKMGDLKDACIAVPPLDEQVKIVEILEEQLSRLDAGIAIADAIEKKASALRRSLLHAAFSGNLTKEWREGAHV